jgi:predicted nucleic-acid-binding protein
MVFLDTNVIIRYITNDDPHKADQCELLFKQVKEGKQKLFISDLVIAETVWILEGAYNFPKDRTTDILQKILNTQNIECENKDLLLNAVSLYRLENIDYIDAYNASVMEYKKIEKIYSYDRDFDKLSDLKRLEP